MTNSRTLWPRPPAFAPDKEAAAGLPPETALRARLAEVPTDVGAMLPLATILMQQGRLHDAVALTQKATALQPQNPDAPALLGNALMAARRPAEAREVLEQALRRLPAHPGLSLNLGQLYQALGQPGPAAEMFQQILRRDPKHIAARSSLGRLYHTQGLTEQAAAHYHQALDIDPKDPGTHNNLAILYKELGDMDRAIAHYRAALAQAPHPATHANLAALLERAHRLDEAQAAAEAALRLSPGHPEAALVLAKLAKRQGRESEAVRHYQQLIAHLNSNPGKAHGATLARAQGDLAAIYEARGEYDHAMTFFARANQTNCAITPNWQAHEDAFISEVEVLTQAIQGHDLPAAPPPSGQDGDAPIFLVGFPRSGTTLLDQLLNAHGQLQVMEEKPALDQVAALLGDNRADQFHAFQQLPESKRGELRQAYWRAVEQMGPPRDAACRLVDKMPLNLINLWLVQGLFPQARIIHALRDPRDVCLSCFTNLFRLQPGVAGFPTIEHTGRLYGAVMSLWRLYQNRMSLSHQQLRYEDLIQDMEGQARRLLAFLELPWDPAVLDYRRAAQQRYIVTPSYHQVVRPLYKSSMARWKNYPRETAALQPYLATHLENFGYGGGDS